MNATVVWLIWQFLLPISQGAIADQTLSDAELLERYSVVGEGPCTVVSIAHAYADLVEDGLAGDEVLTVPVNLLKAPLALLDSIPLSDRPPEFHDAYLHACVNLARYCQLHERLGRLSPGLCSMEPKEDSSSPQGRCDSLAEAVGVREELFCPSTLYLATRGIRGKGILEKVEAACDTQTLALVELEVYLRLPNRNLAEEVVAFRSLPPFLDDYANSVVGTMARRRAARTSEPPSPCAAALLQWWSGGSLEDMVPPNDCAVVSLLKDASQLLCGGEPAVLSSLWLHPSVTASPRLSRFLLLEWARRNLTGDQMLAFLDAALTRDWGKQRWEATTDTALTLLYSKPDDLSRIPLQMARVLLESVERLGVENPVAKVRSALYKLCLDAMVRLNSDEPSRPVFGGIRHSMEALMKRGAARLGPEEASMAWILYLAATHLTGSISSSRETTILQQISLLVPAYYALWCSYFVERKRLCDAHAASCICLDNARTPRQRSVCLLWRSKTHWLAGRRDFARADLRMAGWTPGRDLEERYLWTNHPRSRLPAPLFTKEGQREARGLFSPLFLLNLLPRLDFSETKN